MPARPAAGLRFRILGESLLCRKYVTPDGMIDIDGALADMTREGKGSMATDADFDVYVRSAMWVRLRDDYGKRGRGK